MSVGLKTQLRGGNAATSPMLHAIDKEHVDLVRAANAIFAERMVDPRAAIARARVAWDQAQRAFKAAERKFSEELDANLKEANEHRTAMRRAVTGSRPAFVKEIADLAKRSPDASPLSVARVRGYDAVEARA